MAAPIHIAPTQAHEHDTLPVLLPQREGTAAVAASSTQPIIGAWLALFALVVAMGLGAYGWVLHSAGLDSLLTDEATSSPDPELSAPGRGTVAAASTAAAAAAASAAAAAAASTASIASTTTRVRAGAARAWSFMGRAIQVHGVAGARKAASATQHTATMVGEKATVAKGRVQRAGRVALRRTARAARIARRSAAKLVNGLIGKFHDGEHLKAS